MEKLTVIAENSKHHIDHIENSFIEEALRIRLVEEAFLELFSAGKMNGTVHTCVGQELSAVAVCHFLNQRDWVTSNHRCHGHFISKTGNWKGLIDELMGLKSGVCGGIGSSQHLYADGFLSNGVQGSLIPVGTGIALHKKLSKTNDIAVSFLGEGTLGEGVLYEALNLASLYNVPQLFVCENNFYAQSTSQANSVAGSVVGRAQSFGIETFECNTWESSGLFSIVQEAIEHVRHGHPAFLNIQTYRLNAHSKGDDDRNEDEIEYFKSKDPLHLLLQRQKWISKKNEIEEEIRVHIQDAVQIQMQKLDYCHDQLFRLPESPLSKIKNDKIRMIQALNRAYFDSLSRGSFFIGEEYSGLSSITWNFSL